MKIRRSGGRRRELLLLLAGLLFLVLILISGRASSQTCIPSSLPGTAANVWGQTAFNTGFFGSTLTNFDSPSDVHSDPVSGKIFVTDWNHRILRYNSSQAFMNGVTPELLLFGVTGSTGCNASELYRPVQVATLSGTLFVADVSHNRVLKIPNCNTAVALVGAATIVFGRPSFTDCTIAGTLSDFQGPYGVVFDSNGTLWVADSYHNYVKKFVNALSLGSYPTPNGYLGTGAAAAGTNVMKFPTHLGIDAANGHLFVGDNNNNRVLLFLTAQNKANSGPADVVFGQPSFTATATACANNGLSGPWEPFYDAASDTLFVPDFFNHRVMVWFDALSAINGQAANTTFGQSSLISCPTSAATASSISGARGIDFTTNAGVYLLLADYQFNRVTRYPCPLTPSNTNSQPASKSISNSKSQPFSNSQTLSNSNSNSLTNGPSNSNSLTKSNSNNPSNSVTNSKSPTNNPTTSPSPTNSLTKSPSLTNSQSVSNSRSASKSSTPTPSLSTGASASNTRPATRSSSITNSASLSNSAAPSSSQTNSNSQSKSNSNSPTSSSTPSSSGSASFSSSLSHSQAGTVSESASQTGSSSRSGQGSPSGMGSVSGQASLSAGQSPSNTPTSSPSALIVVSNSATQTTTPQASSSQVGAPSQTNTPSKTASEEPATRTPTKTKTSTLTQSEPAPPPPPPAASESASRSKSRHRSKSQSRRPESAHSSQPFHPSPFPNGGGSGEGGSEEKVFEVNQPQSSGGTGEKGGEGTGGGNQEKETAVRVLFNVEKPGFAVEAAAGAGVKEEKGGVRVSSSFCPMRELDEKGKSVQEENLESSKLKYGLSFTESKSNNTLVFSTRLSNGAQLEVTQTVFLKDEKLEFEKEGVILELKANAIKFSFRVEKWPFKSDKNRLELCTLQESTANVTCSKTRDVQGGKVVEVKGFLDDKSQSEVTQNILKFATLDGKTTPAQLDKGRA